MGRYQGTSGVAWAAAGRVRRPSQGGRSAISANGPMALPMRNPPGGTGREGKRVLQL